jgi:hypothetical protein
MAADKRIVIHHVRGRLSGIRRIVGTQVLPEGKTWTDTLLGDEGEGPTTYRLAGAKDRYVLYRELNTPSILVKTDEQQ